MNNPVFRLSHDDAMELVFGEKRRNEMDFSVNENGETTLGGVTAKEFARNAIKEYTDKFKRWRFSQLDAYTEPKRKGTHKGKPIGMGLHKYDASLLSILINDGLGIKVSHVAELSGVSYGVLRKWRTESAFKKQIETNMGQFKQYLEAVRG